MKLIKAAGESYEELMAVGEASTGYRGDGHRYDSPDKSRPERPCANCGGRFQPTIRRRMLCSHCYQRGG